jgi:glycerol-3-phosphate dehydrogenase (NAD(P)+)
MISILGAGNWGTTLAELIASNGNTVHLWTRMPEQRDEINARHTNGGAVPGLRLPDNVSATTDLGEAVRGAAMVLIVIPSQGFREVTRALGDVLTPDQIVLHATKGLERESNARMTEILVEETCAKQIGVLSGPNLAPEVARHKPAGTVIASHFPHVIELARKALSCPRMMVFAGADVVGVELAGALKNVVAIAAGERLPEILERLGMVAEGVYAAVAARSLSRAQRIEAPLLDAVYRVLYEGLACEEGLHQLMTLPAGRDVARFPSTVL